MDILTNQLEDSKIYILEDFIDQNVEITTEENVFKGTCRSIDGYLNVILENVLFESRKDEGESTLELRTCFVPGTVIKHINIL